MQLLKERILKDGIVKPGNILKVDSFLNHQLDIALLDQIGRTLYEKYKDKGITRILTIEASGIAIACMAGQYFHVPVVFAKKAKSKNKSRLLKCPYFTHISHRIFLESAVKSSLAYASGSGSRRTSSTANNLFILHSTLCIKSRPTHLRGRCG